jgi:hypothetical protein
VPYAYLDFMNVGSDLLFSYSFFVAFVTWVAFLPII